MGASVRMLTLGSEMCACYFRVQGENFNVDAFLSESPWKNSASISRKGEPKSRGVHPREFSSLTVIVTDNDSATVAQQISACRSFIKEHAQELERLQNYPEIQARWFSLAYYLPIGEVYAICPYFETDFLSDLLSIGAEFEFNVFCSSVE
jgi:hypothetical protein